ncbi:hypothetical protein BGX38DRAFT_145338 [Terfezia claveryi]|nr:hypothetical protein BGX38DRAFT_145338 [Terfezia claveryi]
MKSTDRSESGSGSDTTDTCHEKTASVESTVALAKNTVTNVAAKFSDSIRTAAVKVRSELEDPTKETQVATEVTASGQNGKLTTEPDRSGVAVETDLQTHIASISEDKIPEPTSTCETTAHLSVSEQPPTPPAPPAPPPKNMTIVGLESDQYISGEESNTEGLDAGLSQMVEKDPVTPLLLPIAQNKHKHRCDCQCCEERREKRGKRNDTGKEKGRKKREKSKKKSSKKKHIDSGCHICKIERVPGTQALFQVHEKKFAERTESRGSILRDMALGACAGGLGYLVGTMVNRKQTKKKEEKKSTSPFKLFGINMSKIAGEEVAHRLAQKPEVSDNDGIYKLSEIPPTPAPPEGYVLPAANAKPVYPGWNDELPNIVVSERVSSPTDLKQARSRATAAHPERPHRHRHHHREYHESKAYKQKAGTYTIGLPKETLLGLGGEGENKEINVNLVMHMKNGKGEWVAMEKGRQGGAAAFPVVANDSHTSGAFMCGALHGFTVDRKALSPPGKLVAGTTIERKKTPYPPAVYIESDVSELSTPSFLPARVHRYSDVSKLESPFLPTATPPAFPPPHNQYAQAQPQLSKITDLPFPPRQHDRRRVCFQQSSVLKQHQKQTFELPPDSDESEWWRSGGSGEEGGVELNTGKGMGVVDPPLRRRI